MSSAPEIAIAVLAGLVLSASAGFRAFLPLAVLAWCAHLEAIEVNETFRWVGTETAVIVFTAAILFEAIGDKFPAVDHALDALGVFVKPISATLVTAISLSSIDPVYAIVIGIAAGGAVATGLHLLKAKTRLLGNLLTMGAAAPILSVLEDVAAVLLVILAFFIPVIGVALIAAGAWIVWRLTRYVTSSSPSPV